MRIFMTIWGIDERVSIHQIKFDNRHIDDHKKPEIFIKIHKKYEEYFMRPQLVKLHDKNGKTLFLAMECRLNYRCYESDFEKFNGIEIVASELQIPGIGSPSKHYVEKILTNVSRVKFVRHVPSKKEIREEKKRERMIEILKAQNAKRLKMERKIRMRSFPVFLKRIYYHGYFLRIVAKNRLIFKTICHKVYSIIPEICQKCPT